MNIEASKILEPKPNYKVLSGLGLALAPALLKVRGEQTIRFEHPSKLNNMPMELKGSFSLGAFSYLRGGIVKHVESIGRYTSIGPNVVIGEAEHPTGWMSSSPAFYAAEQFAFSKQEKEFGGARLIKRTKENDRSMPTGKTRIGNDVWIGANAVIRQGITIGDGAIIGAGAVVLSDVEPYDIVGGIAAKVIRRRFDRGLVGAFLALKWWEFYADDLAGVPFTEPAKAIDAIAAREASGEISRRPPDFKTVVLSTGNFRIQE